MKYIDAEKLKAEIERRIHEDYAGHEHQDEIAQGVCASLLWFIDSLQQEQQEVDLEKEIIRYQREDMDRDTTVGDVARHFYELGLNARKEE